MSHRTTPRYPITAVITASLIAVGVLLAVAFWLWGILYKLVPLVLLILYALAVFAIIVIVRVAEEYNGRSSFWSKLFSFGFRVLNFAVPWHRLPQFFGALNLMAFRNDLREKNLHNTSPEHQDPPQWDAKYRSQRAPDGTFNALDQPLMGSRGTRFGRNIPLHRARAETEPGLLHPSPREISRRLLARDQFIPATSLNLLAAAWIQFQNHGWFNHRRTTESSIDVPLAGDDSWRNEHKTDKMSIHRTEPDPTRRSNSLGQTPTFINDETHWWDASQLYGSTRDRQLQLRTNIDGKLKVLENGLLPREQDPAMTGIDLTGFNDNWWLGLSMLHTLFAREHNLICERLKGEYGWSNDEHLFQTARLINAALITKIHTVEWTPGILTHPTLELAMNGNWWGLLGERYKKAFGRLSPAEAISGVVGSEQQHHAAPYSLTEEFVTVYRLHPLIPDDFTFRRLRDHSIVAKKEFHDLQANNTRGVMEEFAGSDLSLADLFYTFGVLNPGAVTLHNYPRALRNLPTIRRGTIDLATIDILRDRERGVPRYNEFRRLLRKPRVKSFRKLTNNRQWADELEEIYEGDIDQVDAMVGMYAEPLPKGFGFSDTAFRIFILMASRRLKSDRFYTTDFTPEVYTPFGMHWINVNNMGTVLLRHFPELAPALQRNSNAFAPWSRVQ